MSSSKRTVSRQSNSSVTRPRRRRLSDATLRDLPACLPRLRSCVTDPYGRLLIIVEGDEYLRTVSLLQAAGMPEAAPGKFPNGFVDVGLEISPYMLEKDNWTEPLTFLAAPKAAFVFKLPKGAQWNRG